MNITFDEFKKLDIRVGKILSAEKIEGTDKLLKLEVDFSDFRRQIVSGIAQFYKPEDLVGKLSPFILNLEPRVMRGVESQGMLMAVDVDGKAVLLKPLKKVPAGSAIG
ncbi:MAG: methionine--tRNA ligase subunit beta [Candidatus Levybacteria bacterium]|nr:methionine--tRNA ligase subunit beta [Candidatus Levybacteria bacterium]